LFQLFFPWLLVLAVTYGVLDKFDYFEEDTINAVVSIAVSFIAIGGIMLFVPENTFPQFAAAIAFSVFGFIGLLVLMALAGYNLDEMEGDSKIGKAAIGLMVLIFIGIAMYQFNIFGQALGMINLNNDLVMQIIYLLFLLLVIGAVTGGGGDGED
ncbi:MAG: hypothetical protein ABEJ56_05915, partial [Candidatus Nanohaloarchaea archaeon]